MCEPLCYLKFKPDMVISNNDKEYRMKSDNFMYFRLTIHPVHIGDYKRRKKEKRLLLHVTRLPQRKVQYPVVDLRSTMEPA